MLNDTNHFHPDTSKNGAVGARLRQKHYGEAGTAPYIDKWKLLLAIVLGHAVIRFMPRPKLSSKELARLKSAFRAADCTVRDLKGTDFEIFHAELPLCSHVLVNPYYLQLGTMLAAKPLNRRDKKASAIHAYLSKINKQAKLAKFVLNHEEFDAKEGGWSIFASVRFVTGKIGGNYEPAALKNMVTIWFYDLANLMAAPEPYELCALLEESALPSSAWK